MEGGEGEVKGGGVEVVPPHQCAGGVRGALPVRPLLRHGPRPQHGGHTLSRSLTNLTPVTRV